MTPKHLLENLQPSIGINVIKEWYCAEGKIAMILGHCQIQLGFGGAVSPQRGLGQSPGGGQGPLKL